MTGWPPSAAAGCAHGLGYHEGRESSGATAPEASRAWLLIEHNGPWPAEPADAAMPPATRAAVAAAEPLGIRVQLIRKPARPRRARPAGTLSVFAGRTDGARPWLRRGPAGSLERLDLPGLAAGRRLTFGTPAPGPLCLVCTHGRRDVCCARYGAPLARELAAHHPAQVWETTHVGGHRYAANLVILPHGFYFGPVDTATALRAIGAYQRGRISPERYRGRAGQPRATQAAQLPGACGGAGAEVATVLCQ